MTNPNPASERASTAKKPATKAAKSAKRKPGAPTGAKVVKVDGARQTVKRAEANVPAGVDMVRPGE